jgi:hypothetical protein
MGGRRSGRSAGRATTDDGLSLSLPKLLRDRLFRAGGVSGGSLVWRETATGDKVGSIGYEARLDHESGRVRLRYTTTTWDGEPRKCDYLIGLSTTPQPFGGRRWWFVCPRTGRRAVKLYLPAGATTFASRAAYRLAYRSQRETPRDRASRRALKLWARLGGDGGIDDCIKPKWMRWATYNRKLEEIAAVEEVLDAHLLVCVQKLERRLRR